MDCIKIPLDRFARELVKSGLMTAEELSYYQETFPPEKRPRDGEALALALIRDGKLTKFQARTILEGHGSGLVWGEYVLLSQIGEGGMGQVFKALHRRLERPAAIKILRPESLDSPDVVKRFHQEVKVAARLSHPNIVATYDAGQQNGMHYLVMEYVEGRNLAAMVEVAGPLPLGQALNYVIQAGRGLEYAHHKGIVHRDIKPSNLLVDHEGSVKILDMGLARVMESGDASLGATLAQRLTKRGQCLGTVDYMSPEQATDARTADHRADIYSLGCTLYRLATAKPVYAGESTIKKLIAHAEAKVPALRAVLPAAPEPLEQVFAKMVAKKPTDRYQSMTEVLAELEACRRQLPNDPPTDRNPADSSRQKQAGAGARDATDRTMAAIDRSSLMVSDTTTGPRKEPTIVLEVKPGASGSRAAATDDKQRPARREDR